MNFRQHDIFHIFVQFCFSFCGIENPAMIGHIFSLRLKNGLYFSLRLYVFMKFVGYTASSLPPYVHLFL